MAKRKTAAADGVVGIETLTLDPSNACVHDDANMAAITESISKLGAGRSVLLDADGIVRAGNGSVAGARAAGIKSVRIIETDGTELIAVKRTDLSGAKAVAMALADNRASDMHGYDAEQLRSSLAQIDGLDINLDALGLDDASIAELLGIEEESDEEPAIEEDEVPEPPTDPITKPGDVWILGPHRVLCGDCLQADLRHRLMRGDSHTLLMTDPPYGINAASMTMGSGQSSKPKSQRLSNVREWDSERPDIRHLISGSACVWGGNYFADQLPVSDDWLCWHKKNDGLSFGEFELAWCNFGRRTRHYSHHWSGEKKEHITQKPLAVIAWAIGQSPAIEGIVLDPFLGSGTTLIAADQLGRTCYGMEISQSYCDVIVERWQNLTGKKAKRESNR